MKKTVTAISSIALAGVIATGALIANGANEKKNAISSQAALEIALKDAGINGAEAINTKSVLDRDGIHYVFDVEFDHGTNEYDYKISAKDGAILERDTDRNDDITNAPTSASTSVPTALPTQTTSVNVNKPPKATEPTTLVTKRETPTSTTKVNTITLEKAKSIAVKDANLNINSVVFTKTKFDRDNGIQEYEIDFTANGKEYEYSIDAISGRIIERDIDVPETVPTVKKTEKSTNISSAYISIEKAKSIALNHANLSSSEVRFEKVMLDKDDGIYEYEIEFVKGRIEYEYSINAKTGAIIEYDIDRD